MTEAHSPISVIVSAEHHDLIRDVAARLRIDPGFARSLGALVYDKPSAPKEHSGEFPLTMQECAERLHISRRKLQDIIKAHPFYRKAGRRIVFSETDFNRLVQALPCPSDSSTRAQARRRSSMSAGRTSGSTLTEALALATEGRRRRPKR